MYGKIKLNSDPLQARFTTSGFLSLILLVWMPCYTTFSLGHLRILICVFETGDREVGLTSLCISTEFQNVHLRGLNLNNLVFWPGRGFRLWGVKPKIFAFGFLIFVVNMLMLRVWFSDLGRGIRVRDLSSSDSIQVQDLSPSVADLPEISLCTLIISSRMTSQIRDVLL